MASHKTRMVVITIKIAPGRKQEIEKEAESYGVSLSRWCSEAILARLEKVKRGRRDEKTNTV